MSFIAECVFCHRKVRAPERAAGWSIPCPRCGNSFTLVPTVESVSTTTPTALAGTRTDLSVVTAHEQPSFADAPAVETSAPPPFAEVSSFPPERRVSYLGLASFCMGSFGLLCGASSQSEGLTLPLGGLGLGLGLLALVTAVVAERRPVLAVLGTILSSAVLLVGTFWPTLLNPTRVPAAIEPVQPTGPSAVAVGKGNVHGLDATAGQPWVDASKEAVQQGDVRLRLTSAVVGWVDVKHAGQTRAVRERCLAIGLRTYNVGAARRIPYQSWGDDGPGHDADHAQLSDNCGRSYRLRTIASGTEVVGHVHRATLAPAGHVDDLLFFEIPPTGYQYLRLELPAAACGARGTFQLQLPRWMIVVR